MVTMPTNSPALDQVLIRECMELSRILNRQGPGLSAKLKIGQGVDSFSFHLQTSTGAQINDIVSQKAPGDRRRDSMGHQELAPLLLDPQEPAHLLLDPQEPAHLLLDPLEPSPLLLEQAPLPLYPLEPAPLLLDPLEPAPLLLTPMFLFQF